MFTLISTQAATSFSLGMLSFSPNVIVLEVCHWLCYLKFVLGTLIYYLSFYCYIFIRYLNFLITPFKIPKTLRERKEKSSLSWQWAWFPKNHNTLISTNSYAMWQSNYEMEELEEDWFPSEVRKWGCKKQDFLKAIQGNSNKAKRKDISKLCDIQLSRTSFWI